MRISIVTISFNQGKYLEDCIRSVIEQDYDDLEYIIVDPGSTDNSREIIGKYKDQLAKIVLDRDEGPADGLNKGFSEATGDIYYYLNADDILLPGALRRVANEFSQRPNVDVLLGHGVQINEKGKCTKKIFSSCWTSYCYAIGLANAVQQSTFFRNTAYKLTKGFNVNNHTCWDGELLTDMTLAGSRVKVIDDYLGAFRIYPESISGSGRLDKQFESDQRRIAHKILARNPGWRERLVYPALKAAKLLCHPFQTVYKIADRLEITRT